jgi:hypothetical protein
MAISILKDVQVKPNWLARYVVLTEVNSLSENSRYIAIVSNTINRLNQGPNKEGILTAYQIVNGKYTFYSNPVYLNFDISMYKEISEAMEIFIKLSTGSLHT